MYKVIAKFADIQDDNYIYEVGETYPRKGLKVSKERLAELASVDNKARKILIAKEEEPEMAPEAPEMPQIEPEPEAEGIPQPEEEKPKEGK